MLTNMQTYPARNGGTLRITGGQRDTQNRVQFVLEWEDKVAHCSKCGLHPGEGWPVACGTGPVCGSHKSRGASPAVVCDGQMSTKRGQYYFAVPENYVAEGVNA